MIGIVFPVFPLEFDDKDTFNSCWSNYNSNCAQTVVPAFIPSYDISNSCILTQFLTEQTEMSRSQRK